MLIISRNKLLIKIVLEKKVLEVNAFVGSSNIKFIEMYNNALSDLQPLTFASLESSLISLVISFNKLKLIRYGTFNRLVRLEELHLEYNEIECRSDDFARSISVSRSTNVK